MPPEGKPKPPRPVMTERAMPHHASEPKREALAEAHFPQPFLVPFDLDAEAVLSFDNAQFVNDFLVHPIYLFLSRVSSDAIRMPAHFEESVSMVCRGIAGCYPLPPRVNLLYTCADYSQFPQSLAAY